MKKILFFISLMLLVIIVDAQDIPQKISFQGKLLEDGVPVNTTKEITFTIGGWTETHDVPVSNGIYSVTLGSINPIPVTLFAENSSAILNISVEGVNLTPDTEIISSPYAFKSEESANADKLNGEIPDYYLGIESINNQTGDDNGNLTISGSTNIEITQANNVITITAIGLGTGSVTQINTDGGLTGGPITTTGTISIDNNGVTEQKIANSSVTSNKILDGTIQQVDLSFTPATLPINGSDITDGTISASKLSFTPGDITGVNAGNGLTGGGTTGDVTLDVGAGDGIDVSENTVSVDVTDIIGAGLGETSNNIIIANNGVTTNHIADGTIASGDLSNNAVTSDKIQNLTITGIDIANNTIGSEKLNFTPGDITGINGGTGISVTNSGGPTPTISISNGGVGNSQLAGNSVNSSKIQDNTITTSDLNFTPATLPLNGSNIEDNSISASKLNFTAGDVTGVNAGSGINVSNSGGPTPTVSISSGGVTNSHLGSNCVTSAKIQNGTITTSDLNFTPLTNPHSGDFTATGAIKAGSPSSSSGNGDIVADDDLKADDDIIAGDYISAGDGKVAIGDASSAGGVWLDGSSGNNLVAISSMSGASNNGGISIYENGSVRAQIYSSSNGGNGYLTLKNDSGGSSIWLDGDTGNIYKNVCNFVTDHPQRSDKAIVYACIEGPEAAAYNRGTVRLINGEAQVYFEEHFSLIINSNSMTVQVTPLSADSKGLAVINRTQNGFTIKELNSGKGNYEIDYFVQAVRKGHEDYQPVRNKSEMDYYNLEEPVKESNND